MLRFIAATRHDAEGFRRQALLFRALTRLSFRPGVCADVAFANTRGLSEVYNIALAAAPDDDVVVFTHDDVSFNDWYLADRLADALERFDVVGVAGNRIRLPGQRAWCFLGKEVTVAGKEHLSGGCAHLTGDKDHFNYYGETPSAVRLLDGVFLAARAATLKRAGVAFDARFRFHFYDMDFCRTCEAAGLRLGTWPIAITHASVGRFDTQEFFKAYQEYIAKWGD
jgi:GT2 family glycosyltransferase